MPQDVLRVVAKGGENGGPMVPVYELLPGTKRFVGHKIDSTQGVPFKDKDTGAPMRHAVFVPLKGEDAIHEISVKSPHVGEYLGHIKEGSLIAADEFTAKMAGVKFDPALPGAEFLEKDAPAEAPLPKVSDIVAAASKARGQTPAAPSAPIIGNKSASEESK